MSVVLGGCGDLGTRVGLGLAARGHRVLGLRRHPERLPAPIEPLPADLRTDRPRLPADTRIVVVALTADARTAQGYRDTFHTGLHRLLDAVERDAAEVPRVLFVSSTAVYGTSDGSWVTEGTPAEPAGATATVLREAERTLWERLPEAIVLRLGGLYGRPDSRLLRVAPPPVDGEPSARGHGKRCHNRRLLAAGFGFSYPTYRQGYRAVVGADAPT